MILSIIKENGQYGTVKGDGKYNSGKTVTVTASPIAGKKFDGWYIAKTNLKLSFTLPSKFNGYYELLSKDLTYSFKITQDTILIAKFRDYYIFNVNPSTYPKTVGSVYKTLKTVKEGDSVTLRAREEKGYVFSHWSNGSVTNPITITADSEVDLIAYYEKVIEDTTYYQYRAFIKDQLAINSLPKAFLVVSKFTIRQDLLTTSNSSFTVLNVPKNVNNGDVLVLYSPTGKVLYQGVIYSIGDNTISTRQMQSFYKGKWVYDTHPSSTIEEEVKYLLERYAFGYQKEAAYQDTLMYQEKAPLKIIAESMTEGKLETGKDKEVKDMETFIYDLYKNYDLIFDFVIPYGVWNIGDDAGMVKIHKATDEIIKIGNNAECVLDMKPTTEIEQTNKLIVYGHDGKYRKTYFATPNGIVEEPTTNEGRFGKIETQIVFSDDDLETIKKANIKTEMFNHKVEFTLLLDNSMYDFFNWELGQSLQLYKDGTFYNSVFTGYELSKEENKNPVKVKIVAGKVRNTLTNILTLSLQG